MWERGLALLKLISTAPRAHSQVLAWEGGADTCPQHRLSHTWGSGRLWCQELQSGSMEACALVICTLVPGAPEGPRPVRLGDSSLD